MRKIIIVVLILSAFNTKAQYVQDPYNAVQLSDNFDQSKGRVTFYAENRDYCDYHVYISFVYSQGFVGMPKTRSLTVSKGKQQILYYKVDEKASSYSYQYTYAMYRGNEDKLPNVDFVYRLPVADGEDLYAKVTENRFGYQLRFEMDKDTIYACRGGIICNDDLKDFTAKGHETFNNNRILSQITIYHIDGSFGEYTFKGKSLVDPGKTVRMGSPIAVVQKDSDDKCSMFFSTYFLDKNKVKDKSTGNLHTHFRPFFQTSDFGKIRLDDDNYYACVQTYEMLMQDMNKREKKKQNKR